MGCMTNVVLLIYSVVIGMFNSPTCSRDLFEQLRIDETKHTNSRTALSPSFCKCFHIVLFVGQLSSHEVKHKIHYAC